MRPLCVLLTDVRANISTLTCSFPPLEISSIFDNTKAPPSQGNNNKINWALGDKQELIDILETVYRGAKKGRGLVVSPKDYSTKYRY